MLYEVITRYKNFFEFGDAENFRKNNENVRRNFDDIS